MSTSYRYITAIQAEPWKIPPFQPGRWVVRDVWLDQRTKEFRFKYRTGNIAPCTWIPVRTGRRTHRRLLK